MRTALAAALVCLATAAHAQIGLLSGPPSSTVIGELSDQVRQIQAVQPPAIRVQQPSPPDYPPSVPVRVVNGDALRGDTYGAQACNAQTWEVLGSLIHTNNALIGLLVDQGKRP